MNFQELFGRKKPVIACIHLLALPGAPRFAGDMRAVYDAALAEAEIFKRQGVDGLIVENFRDKPFYPGRVPAETVAALAAVGLGLFLLCLVVCYFAINSRFGTSFIALHDSEQFAQSLGISRYKVSLLIVAIAGTLTGLMGAFYAHYTGVVSPRILGLEVFIYLVVMVLLGAYLAANVLSYALLVAYYRPTLALSAMEHPTLRMGFKVGIDGVVAVLERMDWDDPPARIVLEGVLSRLAGVLSAVLPERESAFDEFREVYIRHEKMPLGMGSREP